MAGGIGKRMGLPTEKLELLSFLNKPLIDWVAQAVAQAKNISEFYVITSMNTPQTEKHCQSQGWKVLRTDAEGYHDDLKQAIRKANLQGPVLTVPAYFPAVTSTFLGAVISQFEASGKDFFAVFVPIPSREKLGTFHLTPPMNIVAAGMPWQGLMLTLARFRAMAKLKQAL